MAALWRSLGCEEDGALVYIRNKSPVAITRDWVLLFVTMMIKALVRVERR